jgi:predicted  nucleic acid-binding Zn-ribbon protein
VTADAVAIITAFVAVIGALAALAKGRSESRSLAVRAAHDALEMLRGTYENRVQALESELIKQRERRQDLADSVNRLLDRVERLEHWISTNTDVDPADINGG